MLDLILLVALSPLAASNAPVATDAAAKPAEVQLAQFRPCVWPNKCAVEPQVAQFRPCVWPNKCSVETPLIAEYKPCVFPNRCGPKFEERI